MKETTNNPIDRPGIITAALAGSALGALFYNMLPLYLGMAQEYRQLSNQEIGVIGSVFFMGYTLITISAFFWIRKVDWRLIAAISTPLAAFAMGVGAFLESYTMLLVSVFFAGGAFGTLYGLCATIISDSDNDARWYGVKIGLEAATGAVLFIFLPSLVIEPYGFNGMLLALAGVIVLLSPLLFMIPAHGTKSHENELAEGGEGIDTPKAAIFIMLTAVALWFCGQTVMWSFVERIGSTSGHSGEAVGLVLAATLGFALLGSLIAGILGDHLGTLKPFVAASIIYLLSLPMLAQSADFTAYFAGAAAVMFSVGLGIPYGFSIVSALDNDGRYIVLVVPAVFLGAMVAPVIAGYLSSGGSYTPMLLFGAAVVVVAMILAFFSAHSARSHHVNLQQAHRS